MDTSTSDKTQTFFYVTCIIHTLSKKKHHQFVLSSKPCTYLCEQVVRSELSFDIDVTDFTWYTKVTPVEGS